ENVNNFLAAAAKAKLNVIGMNVEPKALVDCFSHIYRRGTDSEVTNCFVDIGCGGTRAIIARGSQILFARNIPIGGDHFNRAAASALSVSFEEAKMKRLQLAHVSTSQRNSLEKAAVPSEENSFALLDVSVSKDQPAAPPAMDPA